IASSDKDFMQLVSPRIGLLNPNDKTGAVWTREQVVAKTGIEPEQVVDWLALMGDAVDNIPGVSGVGPKTAAELLKKFGSAAGLLARLDEVKSEKIRSALRESAAIVWRNLDLVRLREVPCDFSLESLLAKPLDRDRLRGLFQRWGFRGMLAELESGPMERQAELI
ncbi:MAG: 5'-3' exonuclease H3TH domain-containing protein, partial [Verrucomicrobiota bacterium]